MILSPHHVEKPWGVCDLPGWLEDGGGRRIGEIWYEADDGAPLPLLVKYIFTHEKLSVQVHPDDMAARARGLPRGKDEGWYIISAEDGAALGIGTTQAISDAQLRDAAEDGSIETLLEWHPVRAGDYFYVPAGTVHAIGPGVGLVEIQPNVDITYRLYDYGRPRALHLDDGVAVADARPYDAANHMRISDRCAELPSGDGFRLWYQQGPLDPGMAPETETWFCIPLDGSLRIDGEVVARGQCATTASISGIDVPKDSSLLIAAPI